VHYLVQDIQGSQGGTSLECGVLGVSPCSSWSFSANPLPPSSEQDSVMGHENITKGANNRTKKLTHKTVQQQNRSGRDSTSFPHFVVNYSIQKFATHSTRTGRGTLVQNVDELCTFHETLATVRCKPGRPGNKFTSVCWNSSGLEPCNRWLAAPDFV
jgi:hypothetical protein